MIRKKAKFYKWQTKKIRGSRIDFKRSQNSKKITKNYKFFTQKITKIELPKTQIVRDSKK
jgi:hypothetical protein